MAMTLPRELARTFRQLSVDVAEALSEITVPAFVLDRTGNIRWINAAAVDAIGDRRGENYMSVVAPEARKAVAQQFSRKITGKSRTTSYKTILIGRGGRRLSAEVDSVRLEDQGQLMGVFGIVDFDRRPEEAPARVSNLTPRQHEVLVLLARGCSTEQIAEGLHLSRETVRNHIRGVLRALGAHSRLEAVAMARSAGIV
jgi:PAS domain S-box-containing protein